MVNVGGIIGVLILVFSEQEAKEDGCQPEVRVARNSVVFAEEKKTVTIHCPFKHCGMDINITWCKVDRATFCQPLHHFHEVKIELIEGDTHTATSTLTFTNITSEDDGLYRCRFSIDGKQMSSVSHSINVSVAHLKCETKVSVPQEYVWRAPLNDFLTLTCKVHHGKRVTATWCKQQGPDCTALESGAKHGIVWVRSGPGSGVSYLTFANISAEDEGMYRCRVTAAEPCSPQVVLSPPLQLMVSGKGEPVVKNCSSSEKSPFVDERATQLFPTAMNIVQITLITALLGSSALMAICCTLKSSGKKQTPLQCPPESVNVADPPRVNHTQSKGESRVENSHARRLSSDYEDCV